MSQEVMLERPAIAPFKTQLLKWVGNKQRFASEIISLFPDTMNVYYEPFLGSGGVLGTLAPTKAVASDVLSPLMDIWFALHDDPQQLIGWYATRRDGLETHDAVKVRYQEVLEHFNKAPNGADFVFLTRACYGGVVRFRKNDGGMSTPCGAHMPITAASFEKRVRAWQPRVRNTEFRCADYRETIEEATKGDIIYCDPPYVDSQAILYGAQQFKLAELFDAIDRAKSRGARVVLSIDGSKKSGLKQILLDFPKGLFETEACVTVGRSMLHRFQMEGESLDRDVVKDRLLMTYSI
ncbi:DNA adenine methylase [Bifidobacterium pseudolongum]|uniref:DNA adenine methylase n=1 Tax=Bifidobacterium pseudolongum TaxID=1694 RepID=UPI00101FA006|nr:Dam family site-specific DNA-(adenine-N6)-methyltransferase [Bifidobacterium pseudolongum]RYQ65459.1 DNA adenine methylase [Bifidobacterium pseudolongum subsp. globosum]